MKTTPNAFLSIVEFATKHFTWIAFGIYASGFFVWNTYLSHYGFFEYSFIQTRFLSAGLLMWLPVSLLVLIAVGVLGKIPNSFYKTREAISYLCGALIGIWFIVFFFFFPYIPQSFGGAKPVPLSILGTPEQIDYLSNFAINHADNGGRPSVQTYPVCLIYQNDQYILFFNAEQATSSSSDGKLNISFAPRVMSLSRNQFLGLQESINYYSETVCGLSTSLYNGTIQIPILNKAAL